MNIDEHAKFCTAFREAFHGEPEPTWKEANGIDLDAALRAIQTIAVNPLVKHRRDKAALVLQVASVKKPGGTKRRNRRQQPPMYAGRGKA